MIFWVEKQATLGHVLAYISRIFVHLLHQLDYQKEEINLERQIFFLSTATVTPTKSKENLIWRFWKDFIHMNIGNMQ